MSSYGSGLRPGGARVCLQEDLYEGEGLPLGQSPPGTVLVGEDVDDFLL